MVETEFIVYSVESIECKANQPFQEENGPYSTCKVFFVRKHLWLVSDVSESQWITMLVFFRHDMYIYVQGLCGRDCMVVGFTTTCAISAYHHLSCEFEPCLWRSALNTTLCDKVWLATLQVGGFLRILQCPPLIKLNATI